MKITASERQKINSIMVQKDSTLPKLKVLAEFFANNQEIQQLISIEDTLKACNYSPANSKSKKNSLTENFLIKKELLQEKLQENLRIMNDQLSCVGYVSAVLSGIPRFTIE